MRAKTQSAEAAAQAAEAKASKARREAMAAARAARREAISAAAAAAAAEAARTAADPADAAEAKESEKAWREAEEAAKDAEVAYKAVAEAEEDYEVAEAAEVDARNAAAEAAKKAVKVAGKKFLAAYRLYRKSVDRARSAIKSAKKKLDTVSVWEACRMICLEYYLTEIATDIAGEANFQKFFELKEQYPRAVRDARNPALSPSQWNFNFITQGVDSLSDDDRFRVVDDDAVEVLDSEAVEYLHGLEIEADFARLVEDVRAAAKDADSDE